MKSLKNKKVSQHIFHLFTCEKTPCFGVRIVIPRFSRGIEEFYDEEFLARKTDEENEELTGLKKSFFRENI